MSLFKYIVKRTLTLIPTLAAVLVLSFFLGHIMPGNPFFGQIIRLSEYRANVERLTKLHGLDLSFWTQFKLYLTRFFSGTWGPSLAYYSYNVEVSLIIRRYLPRTLELMGLAILFAFFMGKLLGGQVFYQKKKKTNSFVRFFIILLSSIPVLLSGYVIQVLFLKTPLREYTFGLSTNNQFPPFRTGMVLVDCLIAGDFALFLDMFLHYLLPVISLSLPMTVIISQQVRSSVLDVMETDFVRTARAKGVPEKSVLHKHIYPTAMNTTITTVGMAFPLLLGNAAIVEQIFSLPGLASQLIRSLIYHDYNMIVASFVYLSVFMLFGNFFADIWYAVRDPRLRYMY